MKKILFKNIFSKEKGVGDMGPALAWPVNYIRDWKMIVLLFAIGLISLSLFAWRIYLSDKIAGGYLAPTIESSTSLVKTVDKNKLESSLLLLETKQADYQKLKVARPKLIDPSL